MKSYEQTVQELLSEGFVKVGIKSYCEYWIKGNTQVTVDTSSFVLTEYERGYEAALKQIKRNLEHMCKGMWSVDMCYEGMDLDRYVGESECYTFLLEELNLDKV